MRLFDVFTCGVHVGVKQQNAKPLTSGDTREHTKSTRRATVSVCSASFGRTS